MGPQLSRPFTQSDDQTLRVLNTKLPGRGTPDESNGYEEVASVFIGAIPDCGALTVCHRKRFKVFSFVTRCVLGSQPPCWIVSLTGDWSGPLFDFT